MNFIEKIIETIKNPKNAMKSIAEQPMIEEAVMIVGISAVLAALSAYILSYKVTYVFEGKENITSSMETMIAVAGILGALFGSFILWPIFTGIIHLISMILGGEGKFYPQMMSIVGYSMIPSFFSGLISVAMLLMMEPTTITISATNPMASREFYSSPYFVASNLIGMIIQIWSSIILFFGVKSAHNLTSAKSAIVVGIPLAIIIAFTAFTLRINGVL